MYNGSHLLVQGLTTLPRLKDSQELGDRPPDLDYGGPYRPTAPTGSIDVPRWPIKSGDPELDIDVQRGRCRRELMIPTAASISLLALLTGGIAGSVVVAAVAASSALLLPILFRVIAPLRRLTEYRARNEVSKRAEARRQELTVLLLARHRSELLTLERLVEQVRLLDADGPGIHDRQAALLDEQLQHFVMVATRYRRMTEAFSRIARGPEDDVEDPESIKDGDHFADRRREIARQRQRARQRCLTELCAAEAYLETVSQLVRLACERSLSRWADSYESVAQLESCLEELDICEGACLELQASENNASELS